VRDPHAMQRAVGAIRETLGDAPARSRRGTRTRVDLAVRAACLVAATAMILPSVVRAQAAPTPPDFPRGKISGYVFGDYYYNLSGDPAHRYSSSGSDSAKANIDRSTSQQIGKDLNGFQIRRIYLQLDNDLSIRYSSRVRLEADSKSLTSDSKIGVAVKAAYLQIKSVYRRGDLFLGLISTPTWETSEDFWQYRSIEKTMPDFRGLGSSADVGAALKGFFDPSRRFGYVVMVGNGVGQKPEDNRYKKFYLGLPARFGDFRVEAYGDYERVFGGQDRVTFKGFAGYEFRRAALGVEVVDRVDHRPAGNQEPLGVSVFGRATPWTNVAAFARVDLWQPDRRLDDRLDSQLWIAGLDWQPFKDVHVMPNIEATRFDAKGTASAPANDELQARITFYYKFSKPQS